MRGLWAAVTVELAWPFEPAQFAERLGSGEVSLCSLVPEMLRRVMHTDAPNGPHPTLRAVLIGGDACPADVLEEAKSRGYPVALTWGMTESASQVATRFAGDFSEQSGSGPALPFVRVQEDGGRLAIEGPVVSGGQLVTNDCGFIDDKRCVHVLGRSDGILISGGENIAPKTVEGAILKAPEISAAAVVGVPHSRWGHRRGVRHSSGWL